MVGAARDSVEAYAKADVARRNLVLPPVAAYEEGAPPTVWPSPQTTPQAAVYNHSTLASANGATGAIAGSVTFLGTHSGAELTFSATRTSNSSTTVIPNQTSSQSALGPQYWNCLGNRFQACNLVGTQSYSANTNFGIACDVTFNAAGTYRAWFTMLVPLPVYGGWEWGTLTWGEAPPDAGPQSQTTNGTCTPPSSRVRVENISAPYNSATNNGSLVVVGTGSVYIRADATGSTKGTLDIVSYKWSVDGTEVSTQAVTNLSIPQGIHSVSLTVTDAGGFSSTSNASVTVRKPVRRVSVSLSSPAIAIGGGAYAVATGYDEDNTSVPGGCAFSWSSSNPLVAGVDGSGFVGGVGAGNATIYAQCEGITGFAELSVVSCNGGGGGGGGGETFIVASTVNPCGVPNGGGGGGGMWQTVCVEYEVGYYYPDTGERVVLASWTECYQIAAQMVASAQSTSPAQDKVALIASGRTRDAAAARVVRRPTGDAIVVDTTRATAKDLGAAIAALQALRSSGTSVPSGGDMAVGRDFGVSSDWDQKDGRDLDVALKVLRLMPIRDVEGYGARRSHALSIQRVRVGRK